MVYFSGLKCPLSKQLTDYLVHVMNTEQHQAAAHPQTNTTTPSSSTPSDQHNTLGLCVCLYAAVIYSHHCHLCTYLVCPVWGRGTPLPPLSIYFLIFSPVYFSLSFIGFTYFLLLSIPSFLPE